MKIPSQKWLLYLSLILSGFAIAVITYLLTTQLSGSFDAVKGVFVALQPIFWGIIMTYLLYPVANRSETFLLQNRCPKRVARAISVFLALAVLLGLFFLFGYLVVPQLMSTLTTLSGNLNGMLNDFIASASTLFASLGPLGEQIPEQLYQLGNTFLDWLQNDIMGMLASIYAGLYSVAKVAINLFFGIIIMVYLLFSRDQFVGQSKKVLYALCGNRKACSVILVSLRQINLIFGGFLTGKVIDSLIIGLLCFISLTLLQIPYVMLISVIITITNIIPVFGPFIGGIPAAFLLLLTDPTKCLVFVIFIIILQQVDGNIIGPMILGDSTGLPAFWVLFSLLLFQHLMGFWGMILGVPLFASAYYLVKQVVNHMLKKRDLPVSTAEYVYVNTIEPDGTPTYLDHNEKKSFLRLNKKKKAPEVQKPPAPDEEE